MSKLRPCLIAVGLALALGSPALAADPPNLAGQSLNPGASGSAVAVLQQDLTDLGQNPGAADGVFGPQTETAVRAFQSGAQLAADGIVGPQTLAALDAALERSFHQVSGWLGSGPLTVGDVGAPVLTLQGDLWQLGYDAGVPNGVFLSATGQALMAFQHDQGLPVTEVVDGPTTAALMSALGIGTGTPAPTGGSTGGTGGTPAPTGGSTGGTGGTPAPTGGSTGGTGGTPAPTGNPGFMNLEFWARWTDDPAPLQSLQGHGKQIGILSPFWLSLQAGGGLVPRETADLRAQVISLAHADGAKVLVSVQDQGDGGAAAAISTAAGRANLAHQIASYVQQWGADGALIDFEHLPQSSKDDLTAFAKELHGLTLTGISVPPKTKDVMNYFYHDTFDYAALGAAVDWVQVMTYDDHGPWSEPGPVAPIDWVKQVANYAVTRIDPHKILLGIPSYSYDWSGGSATWLPDRQVAPILTSHSVTPTVDPTADEMHFQYTDNGQQHTVWGLNAQQVADRVALAHQLGLGGISVWMLGDEPDSFWPAYSGR